MPSPPTNLWHALRDMTRRPLRTLIPPWSWKAALFSAILRAATFYFTNLRSGEHAALRASIIEFVFAVFAAGLIGAISQQLRRAEPLWATVCVVWLVMPGALVLAQFGVHRLAGTPHLAGGLLFSFVFGAFAGAFSWYAMRHGAMLGGVDDTTILHDLQALPGIALGFVLALPRLILRRPGRSRDQLS